MKTYTITTVDGDDGSIKRAMLADGMAFALSNFDEQLRGVAKYSEVPTVAEEADRWREELRDTLHTHGIVLDDLFD